MIKNKDRILRYLYKNNKPVKCIMNKNKYLFKEGYEVELEKSSPLKISSVGTPIEDYKFYGNTIQDGTPTPENPIEIESVGDLITDTTDTNYGKYKIPVNVKGANLFNKDDIKILSGVTVDKDGWFTVNYDNSNGTSTVYINVYPTKNLDLKTDTNYNIFTEIKSVSGNAKIDIVSVAYGSGQFSKSISYDFVNLTNNSIVCDINKTKSDWGSTKVGLRTVLRFNAGQSGSITFRLSVLEDTSITVNEFKYQPYYNQITNIYLDAPLRKIGEYSDYIDFKNKKVVRNIKEVVLNGSERWYKDTTKTITQVFSTYLDTIYNDFICSNFTKNNSQLPYDSEKGAIAKTGSYYQLFLAIKKTTASTTAEFKEWLSNNNVTVDYILAEPTETTIDLPILKTITGENTISIESNIKDSNSYIKYNCKTEEDEIATADLIDVTNLIEDITSDVNDDSIIESE